MLDFGTALGLLMVVGLLPSVWAGITELGRPLRAKVTKTLRCPIDQTEVTATFVADHPRDVISCTSPRSDSGCSKICLRNLKVE